MRCPVLLGLLFVTSAATVAADVFPTRLYDTASGLPADSASEMLRDRRGYVWLHSINDVVRFDGAEFERFGSEAGLAGPPSSFAETRDGTLWIGTAAGLQYFAARGTPALRTVAGGMEIGRARISDLCVRADGELVVAQRHGRVVGLRGPPGRPAVREILPEFADDDWIFGLHCDHAGRVWVLSRAGRVVRLGADGTVERFEVPRGPRPAGNSARAILVDRRGWIWMATWDGLYLGDAGARDAAGLMRRRLEVIDGRAVYFASGMLESADGSIVVTTTDGLAKITPPDRVDGPVHARWFGPPEGLQSQGLAALDEVGPNRFYVSDLRRGLWRIATDGTRTIGGAGTLSDLYVTALATLPGGALAVVGKESFVGPRRSRAMQVWDGARWTSTGYPSVPGREDFGWGEHQIVAADGRGAIWFASGYGLLAFRGVGALAGPHADRPDTVLTARDGLPPGQVFIAWADRDGRLYLGIGQDPGAKLVRFDPLTRAITPLVLDGWTEAGPPVPSRFAQDADGAVWFAIHRGFGRPRPHVPDRWDYVEIEAGGSSGPVNAQCLVRDARGALWVGTDHGLLVTRDPNAAHPVFERLWLAHSSEPFLVSALAALPDGRMLAASMTRGVGLFDRDGRLLREYGVGAGLPSAWTNCLALDERGRAWVGTSRGVALLDLEDDALGAEVPPPMIARITTPLRTVDVDRDGATAIGDLELEPTERSLEVHLRAIQTNYDRPLRFRTKFEGLDHDWSPPTTERHLRFAGLAPGRYLLRVRSESEAGRPAAREATIAFVARAAFYRQPWFWTAFVAVLAFGALAWQRQAAARRLAIERTRTAIATDLHDEVGAGLSQIAVLSETLARRRGAAEHDAGHAAASPAVEDSPAHIAEIARRLVGRMSDLVWAINPERDRVFSLGQRMRQFATPLLRAKGIAFRLDSIDEEHDRALGADVRRELLLAFQELVNNAVKHSGCRRLDASLSTGGGRIVLTVADDGLGFDPGVRAEGTGLDSIRRRAARLGGTCRIETDPGGGARVTLSAPLGG